ncbi:MAG: hypothetical protein DCC43_06745 [Candidatus Brocadia sp.]|nr:hypothetical protein [Candidatus Brocadia fulgida]MCC6325428.1 hypothetical protein [Candidatus Brocadia sp.]MCE7910929.1 hypothetical protein [Candidatus Brocadia sp. AMX3]MDG5997241.1 hypothetical protein [Candidatus Brocadia sp.]RIK00841.1 MAG: hypothetical protein DCC43_06745 [Candidatus Brocadia sp.]
MKQKLKAFIIMSMAVLIALIAIYAFRRVSHVIEMVRGPELAWHCFAIWIKCIILTQTVLVIGGLFLFMLRKPKGTTN